MWMRKLKPSQHKLFPYPLVSIMNACSPAERKLQLYLRTYTHSLSLIATISVACIIVCVLAAVVILTVKRLKKKNAKGGKLYFVHIRNNMRIFV